MCSASDTEVMEAFSMLTKYEGVIPALESSHAVAGGLREAAEMSPEESIVISISGRGDKDIFNIAKALQDEPFNEYLESYLKEEVA